MDLNIEQKKLITAKPGGHMLVRGVAGSGKTTVAVHRAEFLLNNYCIDDSDRVLVVTFNKTLVKYLRYLYDKVNLGESGYATLFGPSKSRVDIHTIDSLVYKYYGKYVDKAEQRTLLYENSKKYSILKQCIAELAKQYSVSVLDPKNASFLLDEIDWIRSCKYMELTEYQNADRLGRQRYLGEGPQRLNKNSESRQAIHALMLAFDARLEQEDLIDPKIAGLLVLQAALEQPDSVYSHVIVDESQDLTRVQLEFLQTLYKPGDYSSFLFVADTAQSIYPHSWLVRGRSFTSIGMDMTGKSSILSKNYRTTTQIAQAAYSLIDKDTDIVDDEHYVKPSLIDKQGQYPVYKRHSNEKAEAEYVVNEIRGLLGTYEPGEIIVIGRLNRQLELVQQYLDEAGLACKLLKSREVSFEEDCIKLLSMHSIKGLEFKVVFIVGLNDDVMPFNSYGDPAGDDMQELTERKLLYVGMTRASERLYMSSSGTPSRFIGSIAPGYLRLNSSARFGLWYGVRPDEYQCGDKILDLFSKEEKVRQWLLRELQEKYGYPLALLVAEYKVNGFSRVGSVDVCIQVNWDGKLVPYIFCEVKALGSGIEQGLDQLKSYMSNAKHCQYGLVTDGEELVIIDAEFNVVDDIPVFSHRMLPTSMEKLSYHCYRSSRVFKLLRDYNLSQELIVESEAGNEVLSGENLKLVPTFEGIAAGQPIYMQGKSEARFYLPTEWFKGRDNYYLLQVKGDSMQGAGIEDGDYVLVQNQSTAENRDIVAVAMDDEATLKRYMRMGSTVLLIPENPKYEPIQLTDNQAKIVGVVIGLLRKEAG